MVAKEAAMRPLRRLMAKLDVLSAEPAAKLEVRREAGVACCARAWVGVSGGCWVAFGLPGQQVGTGETAVDPRREDPASPAASERAWGCVALAGAPPPPPAVPCRWALSRLMMRRGRCVSPSPAHGCTKTGTASLATSTASWRSPHCVRAPCDIGMRAHGDVQFVLRVVSDSEDPAGWRPGVQ